MCHSSPLNHVLLTYCVKDKFCRFNLLVYTNYYNKNKFFRICVPDGKCIHCAILECIDCVIFPEMMAMPWEVVENFEAVVVESPFDERKHPIV